MFKPVLNGVLAIAISTLFAGCTTLGPDFKAPPAPADATFRHVDASTNGARLPATWWQVFGDATLDTLETRALRDNPGVEAAGAGATGRRARRTAAVGVVGRGRVECPHVE
jgi:multidrug efflux system outer membrane protein